jgi:flavin-dependent dehydrogenase
MIVLEKATHPKEKLCGGGITRSGLITLKDLGFPLPLPLTQCRVDNVYLRYRKRELRVRGCPLFVVFHRPEFDHYLVREARKRGVLIQENEEVLSVSNQSTYVAVTTLNDQFNAQMIVGAGGSSRIIGRSINGSKTPRRIARTLEVWSPGNSTSTRYRDKSALFKFDGLSDNLQGYFWEFPSQTSGELRHNQGVYDSRMVSGRARANLPLLLKRNLAAIKSEPNLIAAKGAPIHWFDPSNTISGKRTILVGDSAGVDVLFGEGISVALGYGKIAANEIEQAFLNDDFTFNRYKQHVLTSRLGRYLMGRWILAGYLYHLGRMPVFPHLLWTVGNILAKIWRGGRLY